MSQGFRERIVPKKAPKLSISFPEPKLQDRLMEECKRQFGVNPRVIVLKALTEYLDKLDAERGEPV